MKVRVLSSLQDLVLDIAPCCISYCRAEHKITWLCGPGAGSAAWIQPGGAPVLNFFDRMVGNYKPRLRSTPMKLEPKTFFANERTFLSWLHMAVTIGSIAAALLGFAATADRCVSDINMHATLWHAFMSLQLSLHLSLCLHNRPRSSVSM